MSRDLIVRARNGDQEALEQLLRSRRDRVLRFCRSLLPTEENAEDATQEAIVIALQSLKTLQEPAAFDHWLFTIARNVCKNFHRKQGKMQTESFSDPGDDSEHPNHQVTDDDVQPTVIAEQALQELNRIAGIICTCREVIIWRLRVFQNLSDEKIGKMVGKMQPNAVRQKFYRARGKILAYLFEKDTEIFGGVSAIQAAFEKAQAERRLSKNEVDVFRRRVLDRQRVWRSDTIFRSACLKVADYLGL